jgi:hypothetical protein
MADVAVEVEDSVEYELPTPPALPTGPNYRVNVSTRDRTPDFAVQNFDGQFDTVHARDVRTRTCNRELFNFSIAAIIVMGALAFCLGMLVVNGFDGPGSAWLQTMAAFCVGVFLPNPQIKKSG